MRYELLQLYRNYRNIENMNIDNDANETVVFGHFDCMNFSSSSSADELLNNLYNKYIPNHIGEIHSADMQPVALFTYDNNNPEFKYCCRAISFMQIPLPKKCANLKEFYNYAVRLIDKVISELKDKGIIDDVEAKVYIPLSFMNVAVMFSAQSLNDICIIVKNMLFNKLAIFQYSVLCFPCNFDSNANIGKEINISLRFIWKNHVDVAEAISLLKSALKDSGIDNYTINHLLGNNDGLLVVTEKGYKIISLILNSETVLSKFLDYVQNTRASINFSDNNIKLIELECKPNGKTEFKNIINDIHPYETKLLNALEKIRENAPELKQGEINDIIYKVIEFGKFINVVSKHANKGIATPLFLSIRDPYKLFLSIASDKISTPKYQDDALEIISFTLKSMLGYYENIFHCNLGFFEERGFYNNIIGLASNIELAYNNYAKHICDAIISDYEKNVQKLKIECSVTSDSETEICTSDIFHNVKNQTADLNSVINVNIPVSYVFKYPVVSQIIIHEISHYVGERKRKSRALTMCKIVASVISDALYQSFALSPHSDVSDFEKEVLQNFEKSETYVNMYNEMKTQVFSIVSEFVIDFVLTKCEDSFYMENVVNNIINAINDLPLNTSLVNKLSQEFVNFQALFYENFENFCIKYDYIDKRNGLFLQFSDYSLKKYNIHFVRKIIMENFQLLCEPHCGEDASNLVERECNIYIPDMLSFIKNLYSAISESYCDMMMVTISHISFEDYVNIITRYGKNVDNVVETLDYMTWLRMSFVSMYMKADKLVNLDNLPLSIKYYSDVGTFKHMLEYIEDITPEIEKAAMCSKENPILSSYLSAISSGNEETCMEALYSMYFNITCPLEDSNEEG